MRVNPWVIGAVGLAALLSCGQLLPIRPPRPQRALDIQAVDPKTGRPAGRLRFDHGGLIIDGVTSEGEMRGQLRFGGNELSVIGYGDPPKVRLASDLGHGALSFNWLRPDGNQEEHVLIIGKLDEERPQSLGGQLMIFMRRRGQEGDAAMQLMGVIGTAYAPDGEPLVRWSPRTVHDLGRFE